MKSLYVTLVVMLIAGGFTWMLHAIIHSYKHTDDPVFAFVYGSLVALFIIFIARTWNFMAWLVGGGPTDDTF